MKNYISWWKDGDFCDDEIIPEDPYLKIIKYQHDDTYSYKGYRYWIINTKDKTMIDKLNPIRFMTHSFLDNISLKKNEIELVKNDTIPLSNGYGYGANGVCHFRYSDLIKEVDEDVIFF